MNFLKPAVHLVVQLRLALLQLGTIDSRFTLDLVGRLLQPPLTLPATALITAMPFMIGEVLVVGIPLGDAEGALCSVGIPANKVDCIGKIITIMAAVSRLLHILIPCRILRLGITISRRAPRQRDKEKPVASRFCITDKTRLLIDNRHHYPHRRSPAFIRIAGRLIPIGITTEDGTDIIGPRRLISRTAGVQQHHGHHSKVGAGLYKHISIIRIYAQRAMYNFRGAKREIRLPAEDWKNIFVVNTRYANHDQASHIPGAVNIELRQVLGLRAELPSDKMVLVYCN